MKYYDLKPILVEDGDDISDIMVVDFQFDSTRTINGYGSHEYSRNKKRDDVEEVSTEAKEENRNFFLSKTVN